MQVTFVIGSTKHSVEVRGDETVLEVKTRLAAESGLRETRQRWVVKGKSPRDDQQISSLGLADKAKVMVIRLQQCGDSDGAAAPSKPETQHTSAQPDAEGSTAKAVPSCSAAREPPSPGESEPVEVGEGSIMLRVTRGKQKIHLHCEPDATVLQLKQAICSVVASPPSHQRLLASGHEAKDTQTVDDLGLKQGGRLMLLFKERHHLQTEGVQKLADAASDAQSLQVQLQKLHNRISHRIDGSAANLPALGVLEDLSLAITADLNNAELPEGEPRQRRDQMLRELEVIRERIQELRLRLSS